MLAFADIAAKREGQLKSHWQRYSDLGSLPPAMNKSDFFLGPPRDLTRIELDALLHVKAGVRVSDALYYRLELRDLIEEGLGAWRLTKAGELRLAAGK